MILGLTSGHVSLEQAHNAWAAAYERERWEKVRLAQVRFNNREAYQREKDKIVESILGREQVG
jgi:hypothetical protein